MNPTDEQGNLIFQKEGQFSFKLISIQNFSMSLNFFKNFQTEKSCAQAAFHKFLKGQVFAKERETAKLGTEENFILFPTSFEIKWKSALTQGIEFNKIPLSTFEINCKYYIIFSFCAEQVSL